MRMRGYAAAKLCFAPLALAAFLLSGCASIIQKAAPPALKAGTSRFVVYRESAKAATAIGPIIYINGHEMGKLMPKVCMEVSLEPGDYEFKSEGNFFFWPGPAKVMRVTLQSNATRYVELVVFDHSSEIVNHTYAERTEAEAQTALKGIGGCMRETGTLLRRLLFAPGVPESRRYPAGLYDPNGYIENLLALFEAVGEVLDSQKISSFKFFRLTSPTILRGRLSDGTEQTVYAHCGGRRGYPVVAPCGKNPIHLGNSEICGKCGFLICNDCAFCNYQCLSCADRQRQHVEHQKSQLN